MAGAGCQTAAEAWRRRPTGHCRRVARHAERIAVAMHLTSAEVATIRTAALVHDVGIDYRLVGADGGSFGSGRGGWHWIATSTDNPNRVGFWTQGEAEYARMWVPTWDYPNDLTTSETRTTVPADWQVVGARLRVGTNAEPPRSPRPPEATA